MRAHRNVDAADSKTIGDFISTGCLADSGTSTPRSVAAMSVRERCARGVFEGLQWAARARSRLRVIRSGKPCGITDRKSDGKHDRKHHRKPDGIQRVAEGRRTVTRNRRTPRRGFFPWISAGEIAHGSRRKWRGTKGLSGAAIESAREDRVKTAARGHPPSGVDARSRPSGPGTGIVHWDIAFCKSVLGRPVQALLEADERPLQHPPTGPCRGDRAERSTNRSGGR